ncbi:MAG: undecaprenyl/decaprenyl-phosphate alpha-N-acetylglucosaminyl 1-phosphate transferase [Flavobacteriales bacterium]|nr:undecaprenyl/decaprenyl-phosphate alpha-N-acetylglucosaminyl 1-phosphate transferase [Flavobacteriales bacterium]
MYTANQLFLILSGLFFLALVFSLLVNSVFMRFFRTFGIREDAPTMVFAFAAYGVLFPNNASDPFQPKLLGLLAATGLGFLMGLADDAYDTRPLLKFATQVACGVLLLGTGTGIHLFNIPALDNTLTILWVVGMMNAINMLDNMDAITTVVTLAILVAALIQLLPLGNAADVNTVIIIAVCGAIGGFLFFNWHPSRMYMGDTGSQFLGFSWRISASAISGTALPSQGPSNPGGDLHHRDGVHPTACRHHHRVHQPHAARPIPVRGRQGPYNALHELCRPHGFTGGHGVRWSRSGIQLPQLHRAPFHPCLASVAFLSLPRVRLGGVHLSLRLDEKAEDRPTFVAPCATSLPSSAKAC